METARRRWMDKVGRGFGTLETSPKHNSRHFSRELLPDRIARRTAAAETPRPLTAPLPAERA